MSTYSDLLACYRSGQIGAAPAAGASLGFGIQIGLATTATKTSFIKAA